MSEKEDIANAKLDEFIEIAVLLPSKKKIAEAMGVTERTVHRWFQNPYVKETYIKFKKAQFDDEIQYLKSVAMESREKIEAIRDDMENNAAIRLSAAKYLYDKAHEMEQLETTADLYERIRLLEESLERGR